MRPRRAIPLLAAFLAGVAFAAAPAEDRPPVRGDETLTPAVATALGVTEGLTEYLPVSSTGHLILVDAWLGLDTEHPLLRRDGTPMIIERKPSKLKSLLAKLTGSPEPEAEPPAAYTVKEAADDYSIVIQGGAILAVLTVFWRRIRATVVGLVRRDPDAARLTRNLIVAFIPSAALGFLFNKFIEEHLFNPFTVAFALAAGGVAMLVVETRRRRAVRAGAGEGPELHELTVRQSAVIGCCQCAALWPGTSRSMSAIVGGYLAGLSPARATEFSFLLGFLTLTAASLYKGLKNGPHLVATLPPSSLLLGMAVAGVVAFLSVRWMIGWITRRGLAVFAWYRFALALVVVAWFA